MTLVCLQQARKLPRRTGRQDGMGVDSVSISEALIHADTLEISHYSPTRVLLPPALESMKSKRQAIEAIQRTFTFKITEVLHLNYLERRHDLKIINIRKITQLLVPNIDGSMEHNIKTRKHGRQCVIITVFGPRLYNSLPKCQRDV